MSVRGEWQLKSIAVRYSETSMKGLGMRFFLQHLLPRWKNRNPQVKIHVTHQEFLIPQATFYWADGSSKSAIFNKTKAWQIEKVFDHYRNSAGPNQFLSQAGPQVWSEKRSIQGLWRPSLEGQVKALAFCFRPQRRTSTLKYSMQALRLCKQAVNGIGRWGNSHLFPKGWDTIRLQDVLCHPFKGGITAKDVNESLRQPLKSCSD